MDIADYRDEVLVLGGFKQALRCLYKENPLFDVNIGERALAFRLGVHLEAVFSDFNVDSEYNLDEGNPKKIHDLIRARLVGEDLPFLRRKLPGVAKYHDSVQIDEYTPVHSNIIVPDIIVHRRGVNHLNTLVLEIKNLVREHLNQNIMI